MHLELLDPCRDPEPPGWEDFRQAEGLTAVWAYDVIAASSEGSWARPLLAVFRDGPRVVGTVGAVCVGLRLPNSTRPPRPRREPILLDVRLPAHSNGPTWHFAEDVTPETRARLLRQFERAARQHLGWGLVGALYRMVTGPSLPLVARRGALTRESPGSAVLPLRWSTVEEWLASLGKNRRKSLRRQIAAISADTDLTIHEGRGRTDLDPVELAELNRRHTARLASRLDPRAPLPASYFASLLRRDDVRVISYREGGRLLAFTIVYEHPTSPVSGPWAALRPEEGGRKDLYFETHVRIVRQAMEAGVKQVLFGRGRLEIKRSFGFEYVPMSLVAVPRWAMG
ncbi:GNAT family N-acetyltransferase [Nonomuraea rhodomycinica]|uniref:GNAT family N-acetyltransferase n=1 Tax=Nonomuraea rhodomycinica TaxID=1712872 RepID=A0A7Y6IK35_9ACTN|nr:GNAT family N-acetyltransferase [Nonomuraea rhodomycinica]NUW39719.1 GNAT family N-acetyltransferase [Nonomuraea rhodomycinica]